MADPSIPFTLRGNFGIHWETKLMIELVKVTRRYFGLSGRNINPIEAIRAGPAQRAVNTRQDIENSSPG
jgi:hypothetical protein